jgi:hypothetical protein
MIAFKIAVGVATNSRAGSLRGADPDDRRIFGPLPEGHRPRVRLPIDVERGSESDPERPFARFTSCTDHSRNLSAWRRLGKRAGMGKNAVPFEGDAVW